MAVSTLPAWPAWPVPLRTCTVTWEGLRPAGTAAVDVELAVGAGWPRNWAMALAASGCLISSTSLPCTVAPSAGSVDEAIEVGDTDLKRLARESIRLWLNPLSTVRLVVTPATMPFSFSGLVSPVLCALLIIFLMKDCWRRIRARSLSASKCQRPLA